MPRPRPAAPLPGPTRIDIVCPRPPVIGHAELPVWVPGEILCASDDLGWHGVSQRSCRYHRQDVDPASFVGYMNIETAAYQPLAGLEAAHA